MKKDKEKLLRKKEKKKSLKNKPKEIPFTILLTTATKDDFLEFDKYLEGGKKRFKLKTGIPYWLYNSKRQIENENYILTEETNKSDFAEYIARGQVLVPVKRFK